MEKWHFGSTLLHFSGTSKMIPQARAKAVWQLSLLRSSHYVSFTGFFFFLCWVLSTLPEGLSHINSHSPRNSSTAACTTFPFLPQWL